MVSVLALVISVVMSIAFLGASGATASHRPDAWIKLCGPRNTCLNAPWHPWRGNNVYNTTARGQKISGGVEEGNRIRFWILLQNDGALGDTLHVKGCTGSSAFPLTVNRGVWRYFTNRANITSGFKSGSASFTFPPASKPKIVVITLTFRANTTRQGVGYSCPVTVKSGASPKVGDTVIAHMVTI